MKKLFSTLFLLLSLIVLAACGQQSGQEQTSQANPTVRLIVELGGKELDEQVSFTAGDTVMDVLKANYQVEEDAGFITAIDDRAQDEEAGTYWMFKVNDELANKAADQLQVQEGDKIEFYQETFN